MIGLVGPNWINRMRGAEHTPRLDEGELALSVGKEFWIRLVRLAGLVSAIYLVGHASFLAFLAIVFAPYSSEHLSELERVSGIAPYCLPACVYAALGVTGLKLWRSHRFWAVGLSAIVTEIAMALYAFARPVSVPLVTGWLP